MRGRVNVVQVGEKKAVVVVEGQMEFIKSTRKRTGEKATETAETRQAQSSLAS